MGQYTVMLLERGVRKKRSRRTPFLLQLRFSVGYCNSVVKVRGFIGEKNK